MIVFGTRGSELALTQSRQVGVVIQVYGDVVVTAGA